METGTPDPHAPLSPIQRSMRGAAAVGQLRRRAVTASGTMVRATAAATAATFTALAFALAALPGAVQAQTVRPVPGPLPTPDFFRAAVANGTRSWEGRPGPGYWTHQVQYRVEASLDPVARAVQGTALIRMENGSPDALQELFLHLHQNLHAPGVVRNEAQEITGGVQLARVSLDGYDLEELPEYDAPPEAGYAVDGTIMRVALPRPLDPGRVVELEVEWRFTVPQSGAGRMGYSRDQTYFLAYWYPRLAVHDDLRGWDSEPYQGGAEFYDGFGDYDVTIRVPDRWVVMATGEHLNPGQVFAAPVLQRLAAAVGADTVVTVATPAQLASGQVTTPDADGGLEYRFRARTVRDFTFSATSTSQWDATSAAVQDRDGDGDEDHVAIHSLWRPDVAPLWRDQARYASHAIEHHSRYTGLAYPWPHMTSVEGADIIGGGMEFPMLTLIGSYEDRRPQDLYNVTSHELAHMWVPMIAGTNEKRYAWMDEGLTTFLENESRYEYWPGTDAHAAERENYLSAARAGTEEPLMRHGDYYQAGGYGVASYAKPATLWVTLRHVVGADAFQAAYRGWIDAWQFRHPSPWDLFNAFESAAGMELDWFWQSFFHETWVVDHAVESVTVEDGVTTVRIRDRGRAPMPVVVRVTFDSGRSVDRTVPVDVWLSGRDVAELRLPSSLGGVTEVVIDPDERVPDLNRADNRWGS